MRAWLETTVWWTLPRPSLTELIQDAREGEWTVKQWHRRCRVVWLHTAGRAGRMLPWAVAGRLVDQAPAVWGELPPVRDLAENSELHPAARCCWLATNGLSWIADSAMRTGVTTAVLWISVNCVNTLPVLNWLVLDQVTARYWWPGLVQIAPVIGQVLGVAAVVAGSLAAAGWQSRRAWRRRRDHAAQPAGWDIDDEERN